MDIDDTAIQDDPQVLSQLKKKKCHGNRKDQRFRKRCRARGMNPRKIKQLLKKRKQIDNLHNQRITTNDQRPTTTSLGPQQMATTATNRNFNKRKREVSVPNFKSHSTIPKSASSLSMTRQPVTKKMKKQNKPMRRPVTNENNTSLNKIYRQPMYLKRSTFMLFQMLNTTSNYLFKKKPEQLFIHTRLNLLDRHYFFEAHLHLWQSYLTIGREQHRWPEELLTMAKTNDFELCQQYLLNYIETIKEELDYYERKLTEQAELCPITTITLERMDPNLKEFVDRERKYLLIRNKNQLKKFKENIQTNQSLRVISAYYPTIDQNEFINQLISIREKQTEIWEQQLMFETQILCQFLPLDYGYLQTFITPYSHIPLNNERKTIQINNQRYKIVQEAKRRWLGVSLSIYEMKLQTYEQQYEEIFIELKSVLFNNTCLQGESLFNQINEYMTNRTKEYKQNNIMKIPAFRGKLLRNYHRSSSTTTMTGVSPEPYLDLMSNPLNTREWHYLSLGKISFGFVVLWDIIDIILGPSYIRVNQSAIRSKEQQQTGIQKEHKDIYNKVENHLVEYPPQIPRKNSIFRNYSNELLHYLQHSYFTPLSYKDHIEAKEQADIFASIRKKLRQHHLILRQTDKSNNFYIGLASELKKKGQAYFTDTNAYIQLSENPFDEVLNKVIQLLNQLRSKKLILKWQYNAMMPDPNRTELAYLYFNPKTHKDGVPVRPIEDTMRAPTTKISKFLDKIIRPIFDDKCRQTTIIDGASLIQDLRKYQEKGRLKPTTLFCTFDIHNLYTMLPQDESLKILMEFLYLHGYRKVKGVPLDTIKKLASIVIKENVFVYEKNFYKQTTGGAMGSSFTLTLANIFMWRWQKELVRIQDMTDEYFGRYIDDIFMTWNRSEEELRKLLDDANTWHPNIKLEYKISQSLPFLDVLMTNKNGILFTSVYHKPSTEPYVVPFLSDHHPHVFRNIIQTLLTRAVRYSATFELFHHERRSIKLKLLYNGYPSTFIDDQSERFFSEYIDASSFLPYIYSEHQFIRIHNKISDEPTPRQSQVALSAATADLDNNQTDDDTTAAEPKEAAITTEKKPPSYGNKLFIHYLHEKRFRSMKRDLHQVYDNVFQNTPAMDVRLIVGNRNRRDAKKELIRKKPKPSLLQSNAKRIKNKYLQYLERKRRRATADLA